MFAKQSSETQSFLYEIILEARRKMEGLFFG
jgi:hypothetical protein